MKEAATKDIMTARSIVERLLRWSKEAVRPRRCVYCEHERIWFNGRRKRSATVLTEDGEIVHVPELECPRVKCARCKKSWTLRPPELMARRHYQLSVVAEACGQYLSDADTSLESVAGRVTATRWSVGRWLKWLSEVLDPAELGRRLLAIVGAPILPRAPAFSRTSRCTERTMMLERAASVFALTEALAQVLGREPPGLSAVVGDAIGPFDRVTTYAAPTIPGLAHRPAMNRAPTIGT